MQIKNSSPIPFSPVLGFFSLAVPNRVINFSLVCNLFSDRKLLVRVPLSAVVFVLNKFVYFICVF